MSDTSRHPSGRLRTPRTFRRLTPADESRLLDVALRRLDGQTWYVIADELGWSSRQAAHRWATNAIRRFELGGRR